MSCRPTSRPTTNPALKPTTETKRTTPVPSTQVIVAGLIQVTVLSSTAETDVLFFLAARCDLDWTVAAFLLPLSSLDETDVAGTLCALELEVVRVVGWRDRCDDFGAAGPTGGEMSFPSSDSGTSLSSIGWVLGPTPAPSTGSPDKGPAVLLPLLLGRLLAAAAQESRVVREARSASSLSAWYDGDLKSLRARLFDL